MPKQLRLELTQDQRSDIEERLRVPDLPAHTRMRLECVRLSGQGRTVSEIAGIVEVHRLTLSYVVRRTLVRVWGGVRGIGLFRMGCGRSRSR